MPEELLYTLESELRAGVFGAPGERFLTTRQLASRHGMAMARACRLMEALRDRRLIRLWGKHHYISTGFVRPDTPFGEVLTSTRRKLFGMIVRCIDNPFFASLSGELSAACADAGYRLILSCSENSPEQEQQIVDEYIDIGVSGIFTCPSLSPDAREVYGLCPLPVAALGQDLHLANCDMVLVDNYNAGAQVAAHLLEIGCTQFAYVGIDYRSEYDQRFSGFSHVLNKAGHSLKPDHIITARKDADGNHNIDGVAGQLTNLLHRLPKDARIGIFCFQDLLASDVMQIVKQFRYADGRAILIPEQAAIAGFDDLPIASVVSPQLTTVSYRYDSIAQQSVTIMLDYLKNPDHRTGIYLIPSSLSVRGSTLA
ncbi:MAG: hypothetical protein E7632_13715 [Ruminococcaceae bacterium]|nr:hypothetical protein [Oscillospiraceae bacterium]